MIEDIIHRELTNCPWRVPIDKQPEIRLLVNLQGNKNMSLPTQFSSRNDLYKQMVTADESFINNLLIKLSSKALSSNSPSAVNRALGVPKVQETRKISQVKRPICNAKVVKFKYTNNDYAINLENHKTGE